MGVTLDSGSPDAALAVARKLGVNYRLLLDGDRVAGLFGGIDWQGRIAHTHHGLVSRELYEREIRALLAEPSPTASR